MSCLNRYQRLACLTLASLCFSLATKPTLGALEVPVISQTTSVKPESSLPGPSKEKIAEQVSGQKVSNADIQDVLSDVDSRIPSEFAIPKELRANVNLWLKVYAQLTSQQVVIFDENHPEMIYDSLDFSELSRTARNRAAYEITMKLRIKKAVAGIRGALADLSKNAAPKNPNSMQKTILTNMKRMRHVHKFRDLIKTVRVQTGQRDFVVSGLAAAEVFFPHMDRIFKDLGVPPELTRLALVESSFNVRAISKVGAVGVWQFMKPSAKEYMTVDASAGLDERLSPLKSTVAAAKLLKRNHKALGSWMLAITSYNHGLRTFFANRQLIKTQAGRLQLFDPCSHVKRKLGFASRNYYPSFLAFLYAESYRDLVYGDSPIPEVRSVAFYEVPNKKAAFQVALEKGVSLRDLEFYNPDIKDLKGALPKGYWISLPGDKTDVAGFLKRKPRANRG